MKEELKLQYWIYYWIKINCIFSRDDLLEGEILKTRKGKDFETRYLKKDFSGKITVYRILDSRRENFKNK